MGQPNPWTTLLWFCPDDDGRSGLYDVTERIRQLNEEMARDPSVSEERGPTQSSVVKFKDTLVDFVSPTPEPLWDSEDGSTQSTPRG